MVPSELSHQSPSFVAVLCFTRRPYRLCSGRRRPCPGLTLRTSTPNIKVDGSENLKVTSTGINTGNETLELLNDPRGALSSLPKNAANVTPAADSYPLSNGAKVNHPSGYLKDLCAHVFGPRSKVKYSPTYTAGIGNPSVFTILTPGASVGSLMIVSGQDHTDRQNF